MTSSVKSLDSSLFWYNTSNTIIWAFIY